MEVFSSIERHFFNGEHDMAQILISGYELNGTTRSIASRHLEAMMLDLQRNKIESDPQMICDREKRVSDLQKCFGDSKIYCKIIDNQYNPSDPYSFISPWMSVTTHRGIIVLGWRKNVISINWDQSDVEALAETLFPQEDVTKHNRLIHAWTYEKATEYISKILIS